MPSALDQADYSDFYMTVQASRVTAAQGRVSSQFVEVYVADYEAINTSTEVDTLSGDESDSQNTYSGR